eukprot:2836321-Amphidinium_carterae.1
MQCWNRVSVKGEVKQARKASQKGALLGHSMHNAHPTSRAHWATSATKDAMVASGVDPGDLPEGGLMNTKATVMPRMASC